MPPVFMRQLLTDRQSQPRHLTRRLRGEKGLQNLVQIRLFNPLTGIIDEDFRPLSAVMSAQIGSDLQNRAIFLTFISHAIKLIVHEGEKDLFQIQRNDPDRTEVTIEASSNINP